MHGQTTITCLQERPYWRVRSGPRWWIRVTYCFGGLIQSPNITNNLCDKILNNSRGCVHVNYTGIYWSITHLSLKIRVSSRASFIREFIFFCEYSQKLWARKIYCQSTAHQFHARKHPPSFLHRDIHKSLGQLSIKIRFLQCKYKSRFLVNKSQW